MTNEKFTVDTHLFRELGELLVGRNSTALIELVKNSYDADATQITVTGFKLSDPKRGKITIVDNGTGMNADLFRAGFLKIASRMKDNGDRKSALFRRRFTGAKGIGRLAAHKLAKHIKVTSIPNETLFSSNSDPIVAKIDWETIEEKFTFDDVEASGAVVLDVVTSSSSATNGAQPGTTIELTKLRKKWMPQDLVQFQSEMEGFRPPEIFVSVPEQTTKEKHLFSKPKVADVGGKDPGVKFELAGDFNTGEEYWPHLVESAKWVVEISADSESRNVNVRVIPTKYGLRNFPHARTHDFMFKGNPKLPRFQARIYVREGQAPRALTSWLRHACGIRVYFEGFRVLPYGEPRNDWLQIDVDYKNRSRNLPLLEEKGYAPPENDPDEGLVLLPNSAYFGGVFLTTSDAPDLKMLINREGFDDSVSFESLVDATRTAIYLSVRVRAAAKFPHREQRKKERSQGGASEPASSRLELSQAVEVTVEKAAGLARRAKELAATGNVQAAAKVINQAAAEFSRGSDVSERLMTEGKILRVMASVGTQMAAFVHEIRSILAMSQALEAAVAEISAEFLLTAAQRRRLANLRKSIGDLRRGIEKQASYLMDVASPDARRRRSRQLLTERFDAGSRLVSGAAARRDITIENAIEAELRSPPMFPAELTVVFSNLLTNAVKACEAGGQIRASGHKDSEGQAVIQLENTGAAVNLKDAERWFRPFESTTTEVDPILGQGMGMGLPITRNLLEEYGGTIQFVRPSRGFSTAVQITLPR